MAENKIENVSGVNGIKVRKRDGRLVELDKSKIVDAIKKAMNKTEKGIDVELAERIASKIEESIKRDLSIKEISVEEIQDIVENKLMSSTRKDVAKKYIKYREKRTEARENFSSFMKMYDSIVKTDDINIMQENANVDGESPMGQMGKIGYESAKIFAMKRMLRPEIKEAYVNNYIHPHDLDFMPTGTTTCCQIPLGKLLSTGFNTGHGHMRTPQCITSATALSAIILQANQNMQHGGQAFPMFDYDLAPYVTKSFEKYKKTVPKDLEKIGVDISTISQERIEALAWSKTEEETLQSMEAFVHNMNSMNSRSAGQVPFTSVNYGTDTSKEGRLIVKCLLEATKNGLGKKETPIFPIQIFKVKEGINLNEQDPNYDLFKLACETTSQRLFPNFSFLDSSFNAEKYIEGDPTTEIAYMGCRTRVLANINGKESVDGRGNLSFTTINLVKIALESNGDIECFYKKLDDYMELCKIQLLDRFEFQGNKQAKNFKFLMGQGVWRDSEKLSREDKLKEVLKQGTLSVGFIGLAEALKSLTGKHHGESKESEQLGYEIIKHMRNRMDEYVKEYKLNFSLIATPSEGTAGKFVVKDRKEFGEIKGVTDREYYTNSFHVPVYHQIGIYDKLKIEAQFHELCNAGHITYVELDGNARQNPQAIIEIVKVMKELGLGYGSINHPVDRCPVCGFGGIIGSECPECHVKEQDGVRFERIRRITGYLVGTMDRWNLAKRAEERDRVKHG